MKTSTFIMTSMNSPLLPLWLHILLWIPPWSLSSSNTRHTLTFDGLSSLSSTFLPAQCEVIFEWNPPWGAYSKLQPSSLQPPVPISCHTVLFFYFSLALSLSNILCTLLSYHAYCLSLLSEDKRHAFRDLGLSTCVSQTPWSVPGRSWTCNTYFLNK